MDRPSAAVSMPQMQSPLLVLASPAPGRRGPLSPSAQVTQATGKLTWAIWLGDELHGVGFTREAALDVACFVAAVHRKPAWLLDETEYPLKPIERGGATLTQ